MKIGKYEIPLYFNKEFLKFNPLLFLIKQFSIPDFFVWMPLIGFVAGFIGGLFDWNGEHGMGIFRGGYMEMFLNFLRSRTFFDLWITDIYASICNFLGIKANSGWQLFSAWVYLAFIWYLKIYFILYVYVKIRYIFFCKPYDLTLDGVIEAWTMKLGDTESKEEIMKRIDGSWDLIKLLKSC